MSSADMAVVDAEVAIIGLGPVGTTLALLLQRLGIEVMIIERERELCEFPRAAHFDDEVIRILQAVGLGNLAHDMEPPTRYSYYDREWRMFLSRLFPTGISDQGYAYDHMFFQPGVERAARNALLRRTPQPTLLLGCEVATMSADDDGVTLEIRDLDTDVTTSRRTAYVVGCDGARSLVRKTMGSNFEELSPSREWFIVDVELTGDVDPGWDQWEYCHPDRIVTYIPLCGRYRRFEFDIKPGETAAQLEVIDTTWELLGPWVQPDNARILRHDVYRFHSLLADRWRDGRMLIAGDAAHLMTPKLGQGLCSGMRDAANLAWKLGRVVREQAPDSLLDSYEPERKQPAREFIEISAYMMTQIIGNAAAGNEHSNGPSEPEVEQIVLQRQRLGDESMRAADEFAGSLSQQPTLADGTRLDDHVGYRFALITTRAMEAALDGAARDVLHALDAEVLVADDEEALREYLAAVDRRALLIRPDRYVAGSAQDDSELTALLARMHAECVRSGRAARSPVTTCSDNNRSGNHRSKRGTS